jgi:pimeloyl-ACP methyl ester carboxylesterase
MAGSMVLGLAAVLAVAAALSRRAVRRAEERHGATGRFVELEDGGVLHVVEAGEGPPVVLVHGSPGTLLGMIETCFDELSESHRVIAIDRPGHGWSKPPKGARHDVALNVRMMREALRRLDVEQPIVVGHSYGAATVLRWQLDHPDEIRGLVLLAPAAYPAWGEPLWVLGFTRIPVIGRLLTDALVVPIGRLAIHIFEPRAFSPGPIPEVYKGYARDLFLRPATFRAMAEEYAGLPEQLRPVAGRYGEIHIPTVIVAAEGDRVTRVRTQAIPLASAIPGAELVMLPATGHELFWAHPEAVVAAVVRVEERCAAEDRERGAAKARGKTGA